jgi:hypothetical protein
MLRLLLILLARSNGRDQRGVSVGRARLQLSQHCSSIGARTLRLVAGRHPRGRGQRTFERVNVTESHRVRQDAKQPRALGGLLLGDQRGLDALARVQRRQQVVLVRRVRRAAADAIARKWRRRPATIRAGGGAAHLPVAGRFGAGLGGSPRRPRRRRGRQQRAQRGGRGHRHRRRTLGSRLGLSGRGGKRRRLVRVQRRVDADGRAERRAPIVANRGALPQTARVNVGRESTTGVKSSSGENTIFLLFFMKKGTRHSCSTKMIIEIAMIGY